MNFSEFFEFAQQNDGLVVLGALVVIVVVLELRHWRLRRRVAKLEKKVHRSLQREADQRLIDTDLEYIREVYRTLDRKITSENIEPVYERIRRLSRKLSHKQHIQLQADIKRLGPLDGESRASATKRLMELKARVGKLLGYY